MKISVWDLDFAGGQPTRYVACAGIWWAPGVYETADDAAAAAAHTFEEHKAKETEASAAGPVATAEPLITRTSGQVAHDAYARALGYCDARFELLSDRERDAWIAVAAAVVEEWREELPLRPSERHWVQLGTGPKVCIEVYD